MRWLDLYCGKKGWSKKPLENGHEVVTLDNEEKFEPTIVADMLTFDIRVLELYGPFDAVLASPPCTAYSTGSFRHHWHAVAPCRNCRHEVERASGEVWVHVQDVQGACANPQAATKPVLTPKSKTGEIGLRLLERTLEVIDLLQPKAAIIENPRAAMRRMPILSDIPRRTVTYCQLGEHVCKPTDLWVFGEAEHISFPQQCDAGPNSTRKGGYVWVDEDGDIMPTPFDPSNPPEGWSEWRTKADGTPCHEGARRGAKTGTQGIDNSADRAVIPYGLSSLVCAELEARLS